MPATENYGVVSFNGVRYPVDPSVGYQNLGRWQGKNVFGDYTRDSDELISAKVWTNFLGGIGIDRIREGSDEGQCWFTTLNCRYPFQLSLSDLSTEYTTARYPLGDLGDTFYAADADQVFPWDEATETFGTALTGTLAAAPIHRAVSFAGKQYIPLGSDGYAYHDGSAVTGSTVIDVQRFVVWDDRLIAFTPTKDICESFDGTTWASITTIQDGGNARSAVVYSDRGDNDVVYVATDHRVYAYDPVTLLTVPTRLQFPRHPDNAYGMEIWRPGADMFVTAGLGVYRFNLSAIGAVGLDRDEGLPTEYRGVIKDLCPEHNLLIAYVQGQQTETVAATPTAAFDPGQNAEGDMQLGTTDAYSLLIGWNGFGWHPLWVSPDATGDPLWSCVSSAGDAYRLWWGYATTTNASIYTQKLSRSFANPRQNLESGEGNFAISGYLDTGWFDANMQEFDKLASHLEVSVDNATSTESITISYRTDFETNWTLLGSIQESGHIDLPFGTQSFNGQSFSYGLQFRRIRFRIEMNRSPSDATLTPIIDSFVLKYIKVPLSTATYTLRVMLDLENFEGRGPGEIADELDHLLASNQFIVMEHGHALHDPHRVRLSHVSGPESVGDDPRNYRNVTVVEVPLLGYQGRGSAA